MATEGIATRVREMDPPRYTTTDAARFVGRSADTLIRWRKDGTYVPTESKDFGQVRVWLYTKEDIASMKALSKQMKPGRKPAA